MVLTNFECWAHGGAVIGNDGMPLNSRHMDMFNPRLVQQRLNTAADGTSSVSHISSNGYYGFSYVNAAHELTNNNNPALTQNTNNNNTCVPNANDVNGMPSMMHNSMDVGVSAVGAAAAAAGAGGAGAAGTTVFGTGLNATQRCKKRYFVSDDDYANCALLNDCDSGVAAAAGLDVCASKRCRFDDDYAAAQYCNDFFSLPSTQIGTQSCLMDTEDAQQQHQQQQQPAAVPQQQQQQVDVHMMGVAANFSNQTSNTTTSNIHYTITQQQQQLQQQQQQQQVINTTNYQPPNVAAQAPPVVVYQQQHNYQGHLHRANRDVSRCLLSHMI